MKKKFSYVTFDLLNLLTNASSKLIFREVKWLIDRFISEWFVNVSLEIGWEWK